MSEHDSSSSAVEDDTTAPPAPGPPHNDQQEGALEQQLLPVTTVCRQVRTEFENMRKALTCSICMSTFRDPCVLSNCVHAYCRDCITRSMQTQQRQNNKKETCCPLCQVPCTRRSLVAAPDLNQQTAAYKRAVREFGLAPVRYAPQIAMTQLMEEEDSAQNEEDNVREKWQASQTFARCLRGERDPQPAALLHEQEQIVAVNREAYYHQNSRSAAASRNNNTTNDAGLPTYSQVAAASLSQKLADQSLMEEDEEEEDEYYSACDHPPTQEDDDNNKDESAFKAIIAQPRSPGDEKEEAGPPSDVESPTAQGSTSDRHMSSSQGGGDESTASSFPVAGLSQDSLSTTTTTTTSMANVGTAFAGAAAAGTTTSSQPFSANCSPIAAAASQQDDDDKTPVVQNRVRAMVAAMETKTTTTSQDEPFSSEDEEGEKRPASTRRPSWAQATRATTTALNAAPPSDGSVEEESAPPAEPLEDDAVDDDDDDDRKPAAVDTSKFPQQEEEAASAAFNGQEEDEGVHHANINESDGDDAKAEEPSNNDRSTARLQVDTDLINKNNEGDDDANSSGSPVENTTTPVAAAAGLQVGSVVDVQSRTWPGVNQPGGVAKIVKVHTEGDGSVLYDVQYVLDRRKEKKIDAVFVALQEEIDSATKEESPVGRRPRSTRNTEETKSDGEIPAELRAQLKKEGFDVDGVAAQKEPPKTTTPKEEGSKENSKTFNVARQQDRSLSARKARIAQKTKAMNNKKSRKRKSSEGASVCSYVTAATAASTATVSKRKKPPVAAVLKPDLPASLPRWSEGVQCKKADDFYRRNLNAAIAKGVIYVCTSFLSELEEKALKELSRSVKTSDKSVRITVSESIQPNKTTLCILPAGIPNGLNLTAERRSMKAMQASVLGIPIVSPLWISFCLERKKVVVPQADMYVRSLPTSKTVIAQPFSADFGVAFLAAARDYSSNYNSAYSPFRNCAVYLCGFGSKQGMNFSELLRESGGEVITNKQSALAKIKALPGANDESSKKKIVIICDANVSITEALDREVRDHRDRVAVVNSSWLVDSVSCGVALNPSAAAYEPQGSAKAKELWKLTNGVVLGS